MISRTDPVILLYSGKSKVLPILNTRNLGLLNTDQLPQFFLGKILFYSSLSDGSTNCI